MFGAHPLRVAGEVSFSLYEHPDGVNALLRWIPVDGRDTYTVEQFFRSEGVARDRFLEHFHCGFHGLIACAMTQWGHLTAP